MYNTTLYFTIFPAGLQGTRRGKSRYLQNREVCGILGRNKSLLLEEKVAAQPPDEVVAALAAQSVLQKRSFGVGRHLISHRRRMPSLTDVSLRLGHRAAPTVHRTVIHSRADASLPQGEGF